MKKFSILFVILFLGWSWGQSLSEKYDKVVDEILKIENNYDNINEIISQVQFSKSLDKDAKNYISEKLKRYLVENYFSNYILGESAVNNLRKYIKSNPSKMIQLRKLVDSKFDKEVGNPSLYFKLFSIKDILQYRQLPKSVKLVKFDYDFSTDSSLHKYLDNKVSFNDKNYEPSDLIKLTGDHLVDMKGWIMVRPIALENLNNMLDKYYEKFQEDMPIISFYRSAEYQSGVFARRTAVYGSEEEASKWSARPGYSEHQLGLAVDFRDIDISKNDLLNYFSGSIVSGKFSSLDGTGLTYIKRYEHFKWLQDNAPKYGFHNTYQNGREIDGYNVEPWHWRYLGKQFATYLADNGITFAQYMRLLKN